MEQKIHEDLKAAMKARDSLTLQTLRLALSALRNERIAKKEDLTEEESFTVIRRQVRIRKEAASEFRKAGREELAEKEDSERVILQEYLPAELSDEVLQAAVREILAQTGASSMRDMGKVMGPLMGRLKGQVDGNRARAAVEAALQGENEKAD